MCQLISSLYSPCPKDLNAAGSFQPRYTGPLKSANSGTFQDRPAITARAMPVRNSSAPGSPIGAVCQIEMQDVPGCPTAAVCCWYDCEETIMR